jgi:hypothetical protein
MAKLILCSGHLQHMILPLGAKKNDQVGGSGNLQVFRIARGIQNAGVAEDISGNRTVVMSTFSSMDGFMVTYV